MTPVRWREIEELYRAAQGLSQAEQHRLLEHADPELRTLVAGILIQEQAPPEHASFLDRPAWEDVQSPLDEAESLFAPGAQLGPYRIEEQIGRGGMGDVFRATDTRLQRTVAIKTSLVQFTERFQREARAIAALNHPYIATLYDVGAMPDGAGYLVLEYVEGPTLAQLMARGPVAAAEVQRIALMTAEAIEAAHDKGIVHRDLKPANIKLGQGNVVKVLDFGLAKAMSEAQGTLSGEITQAGMIVGTPSYMSPEQALGGPINKGSDIWSFGALFCEMLSGRRVFAGATPSEIRASVVRGEVDLSGVPPEWRPLLGRCLTRDVRRRLQSIGEARVALEDGLPLPAEPVQQRLVWPWVALATTLALIGGVLIAGALWRTREVAELANPLANATFTPLTDYEGTQVDASISPDGKFVAFESDRNGPFHVWLDQIGGGNPIDLTPGPEDQRGPLRSVGFSHDGTELWITGTQNRRLKMLPLVGGKPRVFLGDKVVNPIWSPNGERMAFQTVEAGDPIYVVDRDGANPRQIFRDAPDKHNHYLAWGADGEWIYFVHGTPARHEMDLWRISTSGGKPERLTQLNTEIRDPVPLGRGTILFLAEERNGSGPRIWAFDLARGAARRIAFGVEQYTSLSGTVDGGRLAVTVANPTARLWSVPIGGPPGALRSEATETDVTPFLPGTTRATAPRFRGSAVYYLSSAGAGARLSRFDGGDAVEVWGGAEYALEGPPAISPDGRRIAVVTRQGDKRHLRLIAADGSESSVIAAKIDVEGSADWSPDGNWIVTGGNDGKGPGLFKIPVAGGEAVRLTTVVGRNPVWSPNGSLIAFAGPNVFTSAPLLAVRPDGTPVKMPEILTQRDGERMRFMPDGRGLIFMRAAEATPWQDFWLLDLHTMNTQRLTRLTDRATMRTFDITPDGKHIVFDRLRENSAVILIGRQSGQ